MTEQRKGYENFVYQNGVYDLGTKGDMRRNERNLMWNLDPYIQTQALLQIVGGDKLIIPFC